MTQAPVASANPYGITIYTVSTPSGSDLNLQTSEEANWYEDRRDRYLADNHFPNVSDLMDLDRLLFMEVMGYRWQLWISQGFDYLNARVDEGHLTDKVKSYSVEVRLVKASLGIDKATRDKEKGESLADYTDNVLRRAKEFGYYRNQQYELAVTKFYELVSLVKTFDRCDPEERVLLDLSQDTIFEWIRVHLIKEWDTLASEFRKNQTMWVKSI